MEVVGEEGVALDDMVTYLKSELYEFSYLQQNAFDKEDAYCPLERQIEMFRQILTIFEARFTFDTQDEARGFFLGLQNSLKNLNFLAYRSEPYREALSLIEEQITQVKKP
jgi:V/A-type H+-transporting ATPase subunit A